MVISRRCVAPVGSYSPAPIKPGCDEAQAPPPPPPPPPPQKKRGGGCYFSCHRVTVLIGWRLCSQSCLTGSYIIPNVAKDGNIETGSLSDGHSPCVDKWGIWVFFVCFVFVVVVVCLFVCLFVFPLQKSCLRP